MSTFTKCGYLDEIWIFQNVDIMIEFNGKVIQNTIFHLHKYLIKYGHFDNVDF